MSLNFESWQNIPRNKYNFSNISQFSSWVIFSVIWLKLFLCFNLFIAWFPAIFNNVKVINNYSGWIEFQRFHITVSRTILLGVRLTNACFNVAEIIVGDGNLWQTVPFPPDWGSDLPDSCASWYRDLMDLHTRTADFRVTHDRSLVPSVSENAIIQLPDTCALS